MSALLVSLLLLAPAAAAQSDVVVVASDGSGDVTTVAAGIAAAGDGDIVLIRPGSYAGGTIINSIDGKGLTLVGDAGGRVVLPPLVVTNLPASGQVIVRNLDFTPNALSGLLGATVALTTNAGTIHMEDCSITGLPGAPGLQGLIAVEGKPGLRVFASTAVSLARCDVSGGAGQATNGLPFPVGQQVTSRGAHAIVASSGSRMLLHRVTATGGDGGDDLFVGTSGGDGGRGLSSEGCAVVASGSTLTGGDGGVGTPAGASGEGAHLSGGGSSLLHLGSTFTGGAGAAGKVVAAGSEFAAPGTPWDVELTSPLRSGEAGAITVAAPPDRTAVIFFALDYGYVPVPGFQGAFLCGEPLLGPIILGTGPTGTVVLPFTAPNLANFGWEGVVTINQGLMDQGAGGIVATGGGSYIEVGAGF